MDVSRRGVLAGSLGAGMALTLADGVTNPAHADDGDVVVRAADTSGQSWVKAVEGKGGIVELHFGHGAHRCALFRDALGVAWYRDKSRLPDGERRGGWSRIERAPAPDVLMRLSGSLADPAGGSWDISTDVRRSHGGYAVKTSFVRRGAARPASVRVHSLIDVPPDRAFTMAPGVLYNGNRADAIVPRGYCPLITGTEAKTRETVKRRVVADIPRQDASTWWTVHLWGNQAASADICAFDPERRVGVALGYARRENGRVVGVIHTADRQTGLHQVTVENPSVRERRYRGCYWDAPPDQPHLYQDSESATVELRVAMLPAADVPGFIGAWTAEREVRRAGHGPGQDGKPAFVPDIIPRSYAAQLAIDFIDRRLWNEKEGFYQTVLPENEREPRQLILGWGSGLMSLVASYALGDARARQRVRKTLAMILKEGQAPTGLFYGARMKNGRWLVGDGSVDSFRAMNSLTPRRTTDTVFSGLDLLEMMERERRRGEGDPQLAARWDAALRRACEGLMAVWRNEGEIPFLLNPHTGKSVWRGAMGGARAIGGLTRGAARWRRPDMLGVARTIADDYVRRGIATGETWGGPSDVMQGTADQESLTALGEGLILLHAATGEARYLDAARHASDILATWALNEHIALPKDSMLGSRGVHPFGALIANTQNMWGTPGLCVNSGRFLIDLYARTGEARHLDLLSDISRVCMQMLVTPEVDWGRSLEPGQMTECLSFGDVPNEFGDAYLHSATWPVNALLLSEVELPSVYIDGERLWRFDHVTASAEGAGRVRIANPTRHRASVRVEWRNGQRQTLALNPGEQKIVSPVA